MARDLLLHPWIVGYCGDLSHELKALGRGSLPDLGVTEDNNEKLQTQLRQLKEMMSWLKAANVGKKSARSVKLKKALWDELKKLYYNYKDSDEARAVAKECMMYIRQCEELFPNEKGNSIEKDYTVDGFFS